MAVEAKKSVLGYMPEDTPPIGAMLSLGFQQVLTMFPATVLVAILTKFDVGVTLLASGIGTIIALLVTKRRIPMYYGSSFSYITVIITVMALYAPTCFNDPAAKFCPDGVRLAQVGILATGVLEILIGLLIVWIGKAALDKVLPRMASANWLVAFITLFFTVIFSVYLQGKGLLGMLPILLGAIVGYLISIPLGLVNFAAVQAAPWFAVPNVTLPAFTDPRALGVVFSIALICIATIPESTAHLYQMSLYIDQLAKDLGRAPKEIKKLIGLNLVADGADDLVVGMLGGCAGTNYGENNSLMAITRNYSVAVLFTAAGIAIVLAFIAKLAALVGTLPVAVTGGLAIYLFGVIGMQGIALLQSERVNLFDPKNLAIGATILVLGIGGNLALKQSATGVPDGLFPFKIPVLFPEGIPAIVFAAIVGILMNVLFVLLPPSKFGVVERSNIEF
jgi:uracil permease